MTYNAGLYIRLSREDGDKQESNSISNQRQLLNQFIQSTDIQLIDYYIDDGFTGTNFERPGFKQLINDIENKKINCVIVKDLSRLGRDYIETGHYLEKYFPSNGIRFIALNDNIDTKTTSTTSIDVPIKNVINDYYAQDISKKVKSAFDSKRKNGEFIGAFAPYGYMKNPENKNHLVVDKEAAETIKLIYSLYLEGIPQQGIARKLNEMGISSPTAYKQKNGDSYINGNKLKSTSYWTYSTIRRILQHQVYIGNLVQKKTETINHKIKQKHVVPKDEQIIAIGTHESIVEKDIWERVQSLLTQRTKKLQNLNVVNLYAGFLKCNTCGRSMSVRYSNNKKIKNYYTYYICQTYRVYGKNHCTSHSIKKDDLDDFVLMTINLHIAAILNISSYDYSQISNSNTLQTQLNNLEKEKQTTYSLKKSIYEDWKLGDLSKGDYLNFNESYDERLNQLDVKIKKLKININNEKNITEVQNQWIIKFKKYGHIHTLDRKILAEMVKYITIYEDGSANVHLAFEDAFNLSKLSTTVGE